MVFFLLSFSSALRLMVDSLSLKRLATHGLVMLDFVLFTFMILKPFP